MGTLTNHFIGSHNWVSMVSNTSHYQQVFNSRVFGAGHHSFPGVLLVTEKLVTSVTVIWCRCSQLCGMIRIRQQLQHQFTHYQR